MAASLSLPVRASTTPGTPTTAPSMRSPSSPLVSTRESRSAAAAVSASSTSAARSSTSCRARTSPGEVADGAAQEARAEVEAEHERGLRHGFEVDRAVARALRRRAGLAHEPGIEERLQRQRHGRLRDFGTPRDLRPRDGRAEAYRLEDGALVEPPEKRRNGAIGHLVNDSNAQPRRCTVDSQRKA